MTNHIHLITGRNGEHGLDGIIHDIKKYTAVKEGLVSEEDVVVLNRLIGDFEVRERKRSS